MISYRTALCFVVALGMTSVAAMGQPAAPPAARSLPPSFRNQPAFNPDEAKLVDAFIAGQVAGLNGNDAALQAQAREQLSSQANGSPAFFDIYCQSLSNALSQVLKGDNFRARLNAAIVCAHVADRADSPRLAGIAEQMIADKNEAIVLWGVKTAKSVIPAMFQAQGAGASPSLIKAVAKAALTRGSGPIVAEAYQALAPRTTGVTNLQPLVKAVFPSLMDLMTARNKAYMTGVPEEPTAETGALLFVSQEAVWNVLTPQEKAEAMQAMSDLIGMAGQRWSMGSRTDQDHMYPLLQQAGKVLVVLGSRSDVNSPALSAAGGALAKVNTSIPATEVAKATGAVFPALKAVQAFANLTPPPQVSAGAPAAAPVANNGDPAKATP